MPPSSLRLALSLCLLLGSGTAAATVQVFVDDPAGFAAATAGHSLLGVEDWSSAGDAPMQAIAAPLQPCVPNGPFPHGTNPATGLTVVANQNGADGATVVPADVLSDRRRRQRGHDHGDRVRRRPRARGSASVPNVVDTQETSFLGIVGAPGEIRRVNVWAGGTAAAGADNIRV